MVILARSVRAGWRSAFGLLGCRGHPFPCRPKQGIELHSVQRDLLGASLNGDRGPPQSVQAEVRWAPQEQAPRPWLLGLVPVTPPTRVTGTRTTGLRSTAPCQTCRRGLAELVHRLPCVLGELWQLAASKQHDDHHQDTNDVRPNMSATMAHLLANSQRQYRNLGPRGDGWQGGDGISKKGDDRCSTPSSADTHPGEALRRALRAPRALPTPGQRAASAGLPYGAGAGRASTETSCVAWQVRSGPRALLLQPTVPQVKSSKPRGGPTTLEPIRSSQAGSVASLWPGMRMYPWRG